MNQVIQTKLAFQRLADIWTSLVQHKEGSPVWELSIDPKKVKYELEVRGTDASQITQFVSFGSVTDKFSENIVNDLNEQLIQQPKGESSSSQSDYKINFELLNNALLALIYGKYHLNADIFHVAITSKIETNGRWCLPKVIAGFLKLDLRPILSATGENLGYGLKYRVENDIIHFSGNTSSTLDGKTVVIQINRKRRIIRELWLKGNSANLELGTVLNKNDLML